MYSLLSVHVNWSSWILSIFVFHTGFASEYSSCLAVHYLVVYGRQCLHWIWSASHTLRLGIQRKATGWCGKWGQHRVVRKQGWSQTPKACPTPGPHTDNNWHLLRVGEGTYSHLSSIPQQAGTSFPSHICKTWLQLNPFLPLMWMSYLLGIDWFWGMV